MGWIRDAPHQLVAMGDRATEAIDALDPETGGSYPGRDVAGPLVELSRAVGELEAVDVVLRDCRSGLIDFPALRDGEEVYLCWLVDERRDRLLARARGRLCRPAAAVDELR